MRERTKLAAAVQCDAGTSVPASGAGTPIPATVLLSVVILLSTGSAGCGYALAGRGSFLPPYINTIGIPQFTNTTPYEVIDQVLTERVRSEFIGRGKYKVLPQSTGVDAVLKGEVVGLSIAPAALNLTAPTPPVARTSEFDT